jgi:hypothetical protein
MVTRNVIPITDIDTAKRSQLFETLEFSPELARGSGSYLGDMDWSFKLIGFAEVYRFNNDMSLAFLLGHELNSNPHNDIAFNPRKAIWEENLSLYQTKNNLSYSVGIFHRCKHDIDNTDPPFENKPMPDFQIINRVLILNGLNFRLGYIRKFRNINITSQLNGEYYILSRDYKSPQNELIKSLASYQDLIGSLRLSSIAEYKLNTTLSVRLFYSLATIFSNEKSYLRDSKINYDGRIELALGINGRTNSADIFVSYESMFEETTQIMPLKTNFWHIGLRLRPQTFR